MKHCQCQPFDVYGFSANCPTLLQYIDNIGVIYDYEYLNGDFVGEAQIQDGSSFNIYAVKVPSSYPYSGCDLWPPISSADPRAKEEWSINIARLMDCIDTPTKTEAIENVHWVYGSRVIRIDGQERFVTYIVTPTPPMGGETSPAEALQFPVNTDGHLDHVQINLSDNSTRLGRTQYLTDTYPVPDSDLMNATYLYTLPAAIPQTNPGFSFHGSESRQYASQCRYFGKEYYFVSTYSPGASSWSVARLKYNFDTLPEVYCSDSNVGTDTQVGIYAICLPSVRAFLLSTALDPDEPWVCALRNDGTPGLVTGRALNTNMNGDGWDGTLDSSAEIENTIIPVPSGQEFDDYDWPNLEVRCYNHIDGKDYLILTTRPDDPDSQTNAPLATFGTDSGASDINAGISDSGLAFESLGDHGDQWNPEQDGYYSNAPDYTVLDTTKWSVKGHSSPSFIGQVSLKVVNVQVVATSNLTFDYRLDNSTYGIDGRPTNFPATDPDGNHDTLELWDNGTLVWSTDNSEEPAEYSTFLDWYSARHSGAFVTIELTPGPHELRWTLKRVTSTEQLGAWLDNIQFPELLTTDDYSGTRRFYYDGTTLRETHAWDWPQRDNELGTEIGSRNATTPDFITVDRTPGNEGKILIGNPHYLFRLRIDEGHEGEPDPTFAKNGHIRWTASPALPASERYMNSECEWVDFTPFPQDSLEDPAWGDYQIMATKNAIQVRGANANLRDATDDPINRDKRSGEVFIDQLNVGSTVFSATSWTSRPHGWTIKKDGKVRIPHIEVLWRFTLDQPAYPVAPPYDPTEGPDGPLLGPWPVGMEDDSSVLQANQTSGDSTLATLVHSRIRDPRSFPPVGSGKDPDTKKPVWNGTNLVVSRIYGDTYSRRPQFAWIRPKPSKFPDPETGDDPGYTTLPWPSAQWTPVLAQHCPSAAHIEEHLIAPSSNNCPNCQSTDPGLPKYDEECDTDNWHAVWGISPVGVGARAGRPDFDAADCDCDCGCDD